MSEQDMPDFAQLSAPTKDHSRLKPFAGTFRAEVKMWMGPGEPHVTTGTMVNDEDLGGRFLRQTYKGDAAEGPFPSFEGRGYWGYNKATGKYEGFWIDSASTVMQVDAGDVDPEGKTWTMVGEVPNPQTGKPMRKKSVIKLIDNDHHSMEMFFEGPDGSELKGMEITYKRSI